MKLLCLLALFGLSLAGPIDEGAICDLVDAALNGERSLGQQKFVPVCIPFVTSNIKSCAPADLPNEATTLAKEACVYLCSIIQSVPIVGSYCRGQNPLLISLCETQLQPTILQGLNTICVDNGNAIPPAKVCAYDYCRAFNAGEQLINKQLGCPNVQLPVCNVNASIVAF